jgi:hypothetical protein
VVYDGFCQVFPIPGVEIYLRMGEQVLYTCTVDLIIDLLRSYCTSLNVKEK